SSRASPRRGGKLFPPATRTTRTSAPIARCSRATPTVGGTDFSLRETSARDLYEAWTGLLADGDLATARAATLFLFERQQLPDGSMPRNSLVNGKTAPDSFNTQLDECSYPILMAYQLGLDDSSLYENHIKPAANF